MKLLLIVALCAVLSGCSWRALNPLNWFGGGQRQAAVEADAPVDDGTVLIAQVLAARAERTPSGVILHATGLAAAQGAHQAELRAAYAADGTFSHLEFRVIQPEGGALGTEASRAVVAAGFFTSAEAASLGSVTIRARANTVSVRLR